MNKKGYVYIITNKPNGVLYIGVTTNLIRRIHEHRTKLVKGFSSKYNLKNLVYIEEHDQYAQAIHREKRLKEWQRQWKIDLIEKDNPHWSDLYKKINH